VVITSDFYLSMPYILALLYALYTSIILALQAKLFLEIKLFTFGNHENKSQITVE